MDNMKSKLESAIWRGERVTVSYKQTKWLILIIPTVTIGLWEYVRHEFLLPYISMELGNILAPVIVFLVTILFLTQLFDILERNQKELEQAKAMQAVLEEREKIAGELHDGIAQALFLMNVQVDRIVQSGQVDEAMIQKLKQNVHHANTYVRQAIASLREPAELATFTWMQSLRSLISEIERESSLHITLDWHIGEDVLSPKEKIELLAIVRESLMNVYKHANANHIRITGVQTEDGWICKVIDDGIGLPEGWDLHDDRHFGIRMMHDRANKMRWQFSMTRTGGETVVKVQSSTPRAESR